MFSISKEMLGEYRSKRVHTWGLAQKDIYAQRESKVGGGFREYMAEQKGRGRSEYSLHCETNRF